MGFADTLRGALPSPQKTHFDDLIRGAYTGPTSGTRVPFRYREALPLNMERRLGENRYLGIDGVEYQDLGNDDWSYTIEAFFEGSTHPADAAAFIAVLMERAPVGAPGLLEHPREGVREVVVKSIRKIHDPNSDANQTRVSVVFHDQLTLPADMRDRPELAVERALASFNSAAASEFKLMATLNTVRDKVATAREFVAQVNTITETMGAVLDTTSQVLSDFNAMKTDILNNMDTLLNAPEVLAAQVVRLVQSVVSFPGDFFNKSDAIENMYRKSLGIDDDLVPTLSGASADSTTRNRANVQALVASSAAASMLVNVVQNTSGFLTRQAAFDAASAAMKSVQNVTAALEIPAGAFNGSTVQSRYYTPNTFRTLRVLRRICFASTQQLTARLLATRIITLPRDTSIFQVCFDAYNNVTDETLWALIDSNNLSMNEMIVIPAGRVLYV